MFRIGQSHGIGVSFSRLSADGPPNELSGLPRTVDGIAASFGGACVICLALTLIRTNRRAVTRHLFPSLDVTSLSPSYDSVHAFWTHTNPIDTSDDRIDMKKNVARGPQVYDRYADSNSRPLRCIYENIWYSITRLRFHESERVSCWNCSSYILRYHRVVYILLMWIFVEIIFLVVTIIYTGCAPPLPKYTHFLSTHY